MASLTDAITHAVDWWCERIDGAARQDVGERSKTGAMIDGMASLLAHQRAPAHHLIERFRVELTRILHERYERLDERVRRNLWLGVDYHPSQELADAAERAGIDHAVFPIKSGMWVYPDYVDAKHGYTGAVERIYVRPGYEPPSAINGSDDMSLDALIDYALGCMCVPVGLAASCAVTIEDRSYASGVSVTIEVPTQEGRLVRTALYLPLGANDKCQT